MKRTLLLAAICCSSVAYVFGQSVIPCYSTEHSEALEQQDPQYENARKQIENFTQDYVQKHYPQQSKNSAPIVTIPVVVHILYNNFSENLSDAIIQSQINVLNEDFRRLNSDASNTRSVFQNVAGDAQIEFCLASKKSQWESYKWNH